jgi:hypothetical protein
MGNTVKAIVLSVAANGLTLATVFGVGLTHGQEDAILAFVGSVTTAAVAVIGWVETHRIKAHATIVASGAIAPPLAPPSVPSAPPPSA